MIGWLRKLIFKIIPPILIQQEVDKYKNAMNLQRITIGSNVNLYSTSKIYNLGGKISDIIVGDETIIMGELCTFKYGGKIEIGSRCFIGEGTRIWSGELVKIGNDVLISHNVGIVDTNAHELDADERQQRHIEYLKNGHHVDKASIQTRSITIEDNVWINFGAIILKGVTIGKGSIVAAGAVVTKDVEPWTVVAGNPAVVVKRLK